MYNTYLDKEGNKITLERFFEMNRDPDYKFIKRDTLPSGKMISTVWLGLDHGLSAEKPLVFETMVFPNEGNYEDEYCERYSTKEEAIKGHERIVAEWSKK